MVSVYFLPFNFIYYSKFFFHFGHSLQYFFAMFRHNQNSAVKIGIVASMFITFVKPYMYHKVVVV